MASMGAFTGVPVAHRPGDKEERKAMSRIMLLAMVMTMGACASMAPPFRVYGSRGDLEQLAGKWDGEYVGNLEHGRRGSIAFDLEAGDDHAHGTVLMIPQGASSSFRRYEPGRPDGVTIASVPVEAQDSLLTIRFVWISAGVVEGVLDSYWDPDRGTSAVTRFRGRADGKRIEGTFNTQYANRAPATAGTWVVSRR